MRHTVVALALIALSAPFGASVWTAGDVRMVEVAGDGAKYWPRWRGPSGQGLVSGRPYTDRWSATDHVTWSVVVPGAGNSSPIVWGDRLFLTTAYDNGARLAMLAFRRADGRKLWETALPGATRESVHAKNGHASATPVTDGERVYASFGRNGLAAFDLDGRIVWHRDFGAIMNYHGAAGSPILYKDRLFLYQDGEAGADRRGFVAAFDSKTGRTIWQRDRSETVGWGTPVVVRVDDHDELIVSGQRRVAAYDPDTGRDLWAVRGNTFEVIPTPVVGHGFVFCSSGRAGPTFAIKPGGRGDVTQSHVAWSTPKGSPFVPSGIVHGGLLYLVNDMQSILTVYDATSGAIAYQSRLGVAAREGFSASPVAVDDKLFFTNDEGETFVVQAGREFKLLHTNTLGERTLASPALVDGTWYWRTATKLLAIS